MSPSFFITWRIRARVALAFICWVWGISSVLAINVFRPVTPMAHGRVRHQATRLPDGRVLVTGGSTDAAYVDDGALIFDPVKETWSDAHRMILARDSHTATLLANGKVLVSGGFGGVMGDSGHYRSLDVAELYDPAKDEWTTTGAMSEGRSYHTATLLADGRVLLVAGYNQGVLATADLYDPVEGRWTPAASMSSQGAVDYHTATLLPDGQVMVCGGVLSDFYAATRLYNPLKDRWDFGASMRTARSGHAATLLRDGRLLVAGGYNYEDSYAAKAEIYDPLKATWTRTGSMRHSRNFHTATLLHNGKVLVVGGPVDGTPVPFGELFDPATGAWSKVPSPYPVGSSQTATLLRDGKVLLVGGLDGNSAPVARAMIFDPGYLQSRYDGLVTSAQEPRGIGTEGRLITAVQASGAFTCVLFWEGRTMRIVGAFDDHGTAHFGADRTTKRIVAPPKPGLPMAYLTLALERTEPVGDYRIVGAITRLSRASSFVVATIDAPVAFYDGRLPETTVPQAYLGRGGSTGYYSVITPAMGLKAQPPGFTPSDYPQGTGFGSMWVSRAGGVTYALKLADGSAVVQSTALSKTSYSAEISAPLFAQLYGGKGYVSSRVVLDSANPDSDASSPNGVQWARPFLGAQLYPLGWPEVIYTSFAAARHIVQPGISVLRMPNGTDLTVADGGSNADLTMNDSLNGEVFFRGVNVRPNDAVTKEPLADNTFTVSINRLLGRFGGVFAYPEGTKPAFQGAIYQKGANAGGHGYYLTPLRNDYTRQSGRVRLLGK